MANSHRDSDGIRTDRWVAWVEGLGVLAAFVAAAYAWLVPLATPLLLVAATLLLRRRGRRWRDLGLRRPGSWSRTFCAALLLSAGIVGVSWFVLMPLAERVTGTRLDLEMFDGIRGETWAWLGMVALGWSYAAFGEELLFRGFALDRLERALAGARLGGPVAAALQAVAFGLAHGYQGPAGMLLTGIIGLSLAGIYRAAGRDLALLVLTHGLVDTAIFTGFYLNLL